MVHDANFFAFLTDGFQKGCDCVFDVQRGQERLFSWVLEGFWGDGRGGKLSSVCGDESGRCPFSGDFLGLTQSIFWIDSSLSMALYSALRHLNVTTAFPRHIKRFGQIDTRGRRVRERGGRFKNRSHSGTSSHR